MKKLILWISMFFFLVGAVHAFDISNCQERMFTVTAYYSPESGQVFYYKPNFVEEVMINGEWHNWASGKKVFNGMLAWPSSYPFWSLIYFPWFGVGEIADRGGAIVLSWERWQSFDRIDVWMGRWEEGLIRALTFGKKNMTGYFCEKWVTNVWSKDSLLRDTVPVFKYFFDIGLRIQQLEEGRNDIRTRTLQKYLVKLWYLHKKYRNGVYEVHTKRALCAYQVSKKIVSARNPDCGVFGKATRYTMKLDMQNRRLLPVNLYATGTFAALLDLAKYYNGRPTNNETTKRLTDETKTASGSYEVISKKSPKIFMFYRSYSKWQQNSEIRILQTFLQKEWVYSGKIDGIYNQITINAVYEFQKKYNLISDTDPLALRGFLGPKTRAKINELKTK